MQKIFTVGLKQVGIRDIEEVGGKNASLGEMLQHLTPLGIRIPDGFVITVAAYREFIASNALETNVRQIIDSIDYDNLESLRRGGLQVRTLIRNGNIPEALSEEVV